MKENAMKISFTAQNIELAESHRGHGEDQLQGLGWFGADPGPQCKGL